MATIWHGFSLWGLTTKIETMGDPWLSRSTHHNFQPLKIETHWNISTSTKGEAWKQTRRSKPIKEWSIRGVKPEVMGSCQVLPQSLTRRWFRRNPNSRFIRTTKDLGLKRNIPRRGRSSIIWEDLSVRLLISRKSIRILWIKMRASWWGLKCSLDGILFTWRDFRSSIRIMILNCMSCLTAANLV